jgi:predicted transposase/invertase (TIGR01784 family)
MEAAITKAVQWCIANNVLKGFFEKNGSEVINMLYDEWKLEDALVVEREEGWEEGWEKGREKGREEGWEKGREDGWEKGREEVAKNALAKGASVEFISEITGLPAEIIRNLASR